MEELIKKICDKCNIKCQKIEKSVSGFTNITHFVNDEFVVKIINTFTKPEKLRKEIAFYKNVQLDFIPQYIDSGEIDGKDYLVIRKLNGQSLYNIWHTLNGIERSNVVNQIGNILNKFHTLKGDFLDSKFVQTDWISKWQKSFDLNIDILNKRGFDTSTLKDFKENRLTQLFSQNKPCLVYNDAHFDNFIYDNGKVYLIDFDRVLYCSIDYELLVVSMMIDAPQKFANAEAEPFVKKEDYQTIYSQLKVTSSDMFDFDNIDDRVFIYKFIYKLGQGYEYNRNNWIQDELNAFNNRFYKNEKGENVDNQKLLDSILLSDNVCEQFHHYYDNHNSDFYKWLNGIVPELDTCYASQNNPWHIYTIIDHLLHSVENINKMTIGYDETIRKRLAYVMFLHDIGKPECRTPKYINGVRKDSFHNHNVVSEHIAKRVLKQFGFDDKEYDIMTKLIYKHDIFMFIELKPTTNPYHRTLSDKVILDEINDLNKVGNGYELMSQLIMIGRSDSLAQNPEKTAGPLHLLDVMESMLKNIKI